MRSFFIVVLTAISLSSDAQNKIDVLDYIFRIELNDRNDSIYGRADILGIQKEAGKVIRFDLIQNLPGKKGMIVTNVSGPGVSNYTQLNNTLTITFKYPAKVNDSFRVKIDYKGIPADGLIISKNQFGNRTFFADNWPNRAHHWIPCVDDPADKATVEFIVTAPSHYQVISNGIQIEESNLPGNKKLTHYKEEVPLPTKVMVIGVADFAVHNTGDTNCVNVSSWVFPENKAEGFYDYAIAKDILAFYMDYIGPYPYKKLANVQSKTRFGGMENAGAIFYGEPSVTGLRSEERLIAHEIVHQWFGNMATEKSFAHFWLSEGFATYLTHVYLESKYGYDSLNQRMREDRDDVLAFVRSARKPVVDTNPDFMQLLNANSYQKGGWVLHMLRRELGDEVFHKSIREYYATYAGKNADTKDLQKVFEKKSGKNLDQFFKQWLYTPENPSLDITWRYDANEKQVRVHVKQLQKNDFHFPLEIALVTKSGAGARYKMNIDKREADFSFSMPEKPRELVADPFTSLLFESRITGQQ